MLIHAVLEPLGANAVSSASGARECVLVGAQFSLEVASQDKFINFSLGMVSWSLFSMDLDSSLWVYGSIP